jgi:uncharacterized protein YjbI with pentapeptide repeats
MLMRPGRWIVGLAILAAFAAPTLAAAQGPLENQNEEELALTKTREEIRKLQDEHGGLADFARAAPAITAFVAVAGVLLTLLAQILTSRRDKAKDREQREQERAQREREQALDREQRERERIQRFDEQFNSMVENLGSDVGATRAAATAQIATFLRPQYADFHEQVFMLLLAALRFPRKDVGDKILARTFQRVAHDQIPKLREQQPDIRLDLSHCHLARIDLASLDLTGADIGFADLHGARLNGCGLRRARGREAKLDDASLAGADLGEARLNEATARGARFGGARLVSATLKGVDASKASFQRAAMQEAHLEGAALQGARFEEANLNNAYFEGAKLDDDALKSIARGAFNWEKAHWASADLDKLNEFSGRA